MAGDLEVPSADVLARVAEELCSRDVRLMLTRVITPVLKMMERAGVMQKIGAEDVFVRPPEAILDYLSSQYDAAGVQELLRSAVIRVRVLLQAHVSSVPVERQVALAEILRSLDEAIERGGTSGPGAS
jgi:SulP family sulfate permease